MAVPTLDSLLVPWSTNWNTRTVASAATFGLTSAQVSAYTALHNPYIAAAAAAESEGAKSQALVAARGSAKAALLPYARELYALVLASRSVGDADKLLLGINLRRVPGPVPPPAQTPILEVGQRWGTAVEVRAHGSQSAHAKPPGAQTLSLFSFVGPTPPPGNEGWQFQGATSRNRIVVAFPPDTAPGTVVWLCGFWANRRGESSAACSPVSAIIAGGGATLKAA